jgi:prepilin-type N-terminal cleavage/methylation domain-containing protein
MKFEPDIKQVAARNHLAFTLIELLVVIAIIGVVAGLIFGVQGKVKSAQNEKVVRAKLEELVTAIEAYKRRYNQYPPDASFGSGGISPTNRYFDTLYYELTGTEYVASSVPGLPNPPYFKSSVDGEYLFTLPYAQNYPITNVFGVAGFVNVTMPSQSSRDAVKAKSYLRNLQPNHWALVANNPNKLRVLTVPVKTIAANMANALSDTGQPIKVNTWRYNPRAPVHNPGGFDLWAEIEDGFDNGVPRTKVIGNWK